MLFTTYELKLIHSFVVILDFRHGHGLKPALHFAFVGSLFQVVFAEFVDQTSADGVSKNVNCRTESANCIDFKTLQDLEKFKFSVPVKKPIDCQDQSNIFSWQTNGVQNHDHGDQTSLWNTSGANGSCSSRNGHRDDLSDTHLHLTNLRNENGGHSLVQCGTIHINCSPNRKHKSVK